MIRKLDENTIEVNLPNRIGVERIAMDCSASFAKMGGLLPERIDDLKTAVAEACLNAIEHGNQGRPDARVIVVMNLDEGEFSVSVMDEGEGIRVAPAPPNIQKQVENLEPPNGLGLFLIKELVDNVDFNASTTEGHVVKMIVKISN